MIINYNNHSHVYLNFHIIYDILDKNYLVLPTLREKYLKNEAINNWLVTNNLGRLKLTVKATAFQKQQTLQTQLPFKSLTILF